MDYGRTKWNITQKLFVSNKKNTKKYLYLYLFTYITYCFPSDRTTN